MKVVITTPYYPPHIGGIEIHVKNLARGIKKRGHKVEVITSFGQDNEIKITTLQSLKIPYSPIPLFFPKIKADVYHSHIPSPFFARSLMKRKCKPHIVTYHNDVIIPEKINGIHIPNFVARLIEKKNINLTKQILESAEVIITTTRSYARTSSILSKYIDKVKIIPNGINIKDFIPGRDAGERKRIVLYVGRLIEYKGLPLLFEAMRNVQKEVNCKFIVVGGGRYRKFKKLAMRSGVEVEFKGKLPAKDVKELMQKARVLVLPSQSRLEAFGIVLLEAMACKTPIIASKIPGVMDIANEGGLTFRDKYELIRHIVRILTNDNLATKIGRKGRENVKKYDWKIILNEIEKIYRNLRV